MKKTTLEFQYSNAGFEERGVVGSTGEGHEARIIPTWHHDRHLDAASGRRRQVDDGGSIGNEVGRGENEFLVGLVNAGLDQLGGGMVSEIRSGGHDLGHDPVLSSRNGFEQLIDEGLVRIEKPALDEQQVKLLCNGADEPNHAVDPRGELGFQGEVGLGEILASGPGQFMIDDRDLSVISQIEPCEDGTDGVGGESGSHLHPGLLHAFGEGGAEEELASHSVDQHSARDASVDRTDQSVADARSGVVIKPDVEEEMAMLLRAIDVHRHPADDLGGVPEQLDGIASDRSAAADLLCETSQM